MAKGTLIQKIIDAHFMSGSHEQGQPVCIKIDQTLTQDATGTLAALEFEAMTREPVSAGLSLFYVDHNMAQMGPENRNDHIYLRTFSSSRGAIYSPPGNGVCHQLHLERFGKPGATLLGSDSHTPTGGGLGMLAIGAGGLDVARAMAGKPFEVQYPHILGVRLTGKLTPWVAAKDVILKLLQILGTHGNTGWAIEYFGEGVKSLSVTQRATISNMGAELGVTAGVFPADENTRAFLKAQGREKDFAPLASDADAEYDRIIDINLSELVPLAAQPSSPGNVAPLADLTNVKVDQVLIGSCTNGSYKDLAMVAKALKGRHVAPGIGFSVAPGSRQTLAMLAKNGMLNDLILAGARILEPGCGACIGQGVSPADDTVSVRTFNRNFAGRSGTKGDKLYLVSCESAVAAALSGHLMDPRGLGFAYPEVEEPESFDLEADQFERPMPGTVIVRKPTIGTPPVGDAMPENLDGKVLIKVPDQTTTDHIMPAGAFLKYRSNIPRYSDFVFNCFNCAGEPTFADRARALKSEGKAGVIVAGLSYGQGSSREHAAVCPMHLGVRAVMALGFERIHRTNLINFGILPLVFANADEQKQIEAGDSILIDGLRQQIQQGTQVTATVKKADGKTFEVHLVHDLSKNELDTVLAGGRLNQE